MLSQTIKITVIAVGISVCLTADGTAQQDVAEWPQFRGLTAGAVADDPLLPDRWSATENVAWAVDIPGLGWSSPVVAGELVFMTSAISSGDERAPVPGLYDPGESFGKTRSDATHQWMVYAIDFDTGSVRWARELEALVPTELKHVKNSFASETPVTDGRRVYVYFGSIGLLAALNMSGETVWRAHVGSFNGGQEFGTAASPVLHGGRLYIVNDNTTSSFLAAFNADTGDEVWRVERDETENWSTPFVWVNEVRTEIVTTGRQKIRSYDVHGNLLWELGGMTVNVVPTPFAANGLLYLSSGYPGGYPRPVYAVRPGAAGDISLDEGETGNEFIAWYQPLLGTYSTSALVYGDYYYTLLDRGFLLCHDARTGEEIYGRQRIAPGHGFTASPWGYNGNIFVLSEDGDTYVIRSGSTFEILHTNSLDEMSLATPAIARGSLFIRTQSKLYRFTKRGGIAQPATLD
jgi:outer membrane protein assembly factor BamB